MKVSGRGDCVAINAKMILVVHPPEFLAEYPYDKVVTWGKSRHPSYWFW